MMSFPSADCTGPDDCLVTGSPPVWRQSWLADVAVHAAPIG
jgi:hypothetical protein